MDRPLKQVCVVAHPDDEVMWFGGLVLANPGDWTVICLSVPRRDSMRSWKFFEACERLGARGQLVASIEPAPTEPFPIEILALLDLDRYDLIATHGREGEYGHRHHVQVSEFVRFRWGGRQLWERAPIGAEGVNATLALDDCLQARKLFALQAYDHVLPYEGREMTKWEALLKRYGDDWRFDVECYRRHA